MIYLVDSKDEVVMATLFLIRTPRSHTYFATNKEKWHHVPSLSGCSIFGPLYYLALFDWFVVIWVFFLLFPLVLMVTFLRLVWTYMFLVLRKWHFLKNSGFSLTNDFWSFVFLSLILHMISYNWLGNILTFLWNYFWNESEM